MSIRATQRTFAPGRLLASLGCVLLAFSTPSLAQFDETAPQLQRLTDERIMLTSELDQFRTTLAMLHTQDTPPEQSSNPAIRSLAIQATELKKQLIAVTEQEVTLLQQQIIAAKAKTREAQQQHTRTETALASAEARPAGSMESKPLRNFNVDYSGEHEAKNVERLHKLLENYYTELQESASVLPTAEEKANRQLAQRDAENLGRIPYSVDKVRLSGAEGSTALQHITQRLNDARIPESRRDIAPICMIRTRLFDTLVGSESRSLKPVGKNHYIARVRLQPGDTTLTIMSDVWELRLPSHSNARDFLITLYRPDNATPELHIFAVEDLLAQDTPYIPAWLPAELDLKKKSG